VSLLCQVECSEHVPLLHALATDGARTTCARQTSEFESKVWKEADWAATLLIRHRRATSARRGACRALFSRGFSGRRPATNGPPCLWALSNQGAAAGAAQSSSAQRTPAKNRCASSSALAPKAALTASSNGARCCRLMSSARKCSSLADLRSASSIML